MSFFANDINKREHSLWVEKYRPQTLADYVGNETIKETIQQYLDANDIVGYGRIIICAILSPTL